jgi:hypothetical protein
MGYGPSDIVTRNFVFWSSAASGLDLVIVEWRKKRANRRAARA